MSDSGAEEARERLRRALRGYAGRRRAMAAARPAADGAATRAEAAGEPAFGEASVRGRAAAITDAEAARASAAGAPAFGEAVRGPASGTRDERGLRALAKEIKALISEDGRRGIRVG